MPSSPVDAQGADSSTLDLVANPFTLGGSAEVVEFKSDVRRVELSEPRDSSSASALER